MLTGLGPLNAKLAIVTDYPSKKEEKHKNPVSEFVGKNVEEFLRSQPSDLKIGLAECYRTSYCRVFPEGAEARLPAKREKVAREVLANPQWDLLLFEELKKLQPNVILSLGEIALRGITGHKSISKYRGSILPVKPDWIDALPNVKVVPTLHPRFMWTQYNAKVYVKLDYEKALRYRKDFRPFKENMLIWVCRHPNQLQDYWSRVRKQEIKYYTCDIETYAGYLTYIGFCFDGYEAVSIPLLDWKIPGPERAMLWKICDEILRSKYPLVNQNIKYDAHYLEKWGFSSGNISGDTMLAGHTLYPELPKNLGFYTSIYTDFPYHKDEGKDFNPSTNPDQLGRYNAKDCIVTWKIYEEMVKDLKDTKTYHFYKDFVMPLFHVYRKIDNRGLYVDDELRNKLIRKYKFIRIKHKHFIDTLAGRNINFGSFHQVGNFIYGDLGIPAHTKMTPSGKINFIINATLIEDIYVQQLSKDSKRAKILKTVLGIRKLDTALQFLEGIRVHPDGKLRTTYRLEGTESGRTSGSEHLDLGMEFVTDYLKTMTKTKLKIFNYGHGFQTFPKHGFDEFEDLDGVLGKDILSIFKPTPGYSFVEGDGSQAEARVVALLATDWDTLELMNRTDFKRNQYGIKDDLHTLTAIWTTEKPFEEITYEDREKKGKRPRHAGNYDQGPGGLSPIIHLPIEECRTILRRFHDSMPKLRQIYHRTCADTVRKQGCLVTPYGRRRDFFDKYNDKLLKVAYSYIPQSTVSDHYKSCIIPLEEKFTFEEARTVVEKHDSLMSKVRNDKVEEWGRAFKEISEKEIDFSTCSIPRTEKLVIPSEVVYSSEGWTEDMKELKL